MKAMLSTLDAALLAVFATVTPNVLGAEPAEKVEQVTKMTLGRAIALADSGKNLIHILDAKGNILWQYPADSPRDVWVLPSGNVLFTHGRGVKEVTRDKQVVWEYAFPETSEIHACQPFADGSVMIAESGPIASSKSTVAARSSKRSSCDRQKRTCIVKCVVAANSPTVIIWSDSTYDGVIREYDEDGAVVGEIKHSDAHAGLRLPNGNTLCSFGNAHRLVEYNAQGKVVWSVEENDLPGCPLRFVGPAWRLPNGNTIICNWAGHGYVGQQPQLVEITAEKKVVGELFDYARFGTISGFFVLDPNDK